jgi:hypothetical protein
MYLICEFLNKGEDISVEYPSGGSSHYTVRIGRTIGYMDDVDNDIIRTRRGIL